MIIKSMSRKHPTFRQLLDYFHRTGVDADAAYVRNIYVAPDGFNERGVAKAFETNARLLPARANGNALYHEVLALESQPHQSKARLTEILHDLAEQYLIRRAPNQLAYCYVHFDTDYPHCHVLISANAVRSNRRVRLSKAELGAVQREVEAYRFERYPELVGDHIYDRSAGREKKRSAAVEAVRVVVERALSQARGQADMDQVLQAAGYTLYRRGSTWGVEAPDTGRRYRLKTIGLLNTFTQSTDRAETRALREQELAERRELLGQASAREANGWDMEGGR